MAENKLYGEGCVGGGAGSVVVAAPQCNTRSRIGDIIVFLASCEESDIRAGIGSLFGLGSPEKIERFRKGLAEAMEKT